MVKVIRYSFLLSLLLCVNIVLSIDNGLGLTPQMGWNSWNRFGCGVNETVVRSAAQQLVSTGLAAAGYTYVNIDDCWAGWRDIYGYVHADNKTFPSGMAALAKYVHGLGLKFGLYSDSGNTTCAGRPGSWGYEKQDAESYASWEVDYLKFDNCATPSYLPDVERYADMEDALNATGRPIFFSLCTGMLSTSFWGPLVGNSWRTTYDINPSWHSWSGNIQQNNVAWKQAGPGGWNDPDMLEIGNGMSENEEIAHFSLWALAKAPLIIGCDLTTITNESLNILTNKEVIAVSQDPLGVQGRQVAVYPETGFLNASTSSTNVILAPCNSKWDSQQLIYMTDHTIATLDGRCIGQYSPSWDCGFWEGAAVMAQPCDPACKNIFGWNLIDGQLQNIAVEGWCVLVNQFCEGPYFEIAQCSEVDHNQTFIHNEKNRSFTVFGSELCLTVSSGAEVWAAPMSDKSAAVVLFNKAEYKQNITVYWQDIWLAAGQQAEVRDLWAHVSRGEFNSSYSAEVHPHSVVMVRITPI